MPGKLPDLVRFGAFVLEPSRRKLLHGGRQVRLGGRAMDLLLTLAARPGEVIGKKALLGAVWPDTIVQDDNLKVTVAQLRRELRRHSPSADPIKTLIGRGYWLEVATTTNRATRAPALATAPLPPAADLIGRAAELERAEALLGSSRLVSIVGPGGVGKTSLAVSLARQLSGCSDTLVGFVDLSSVAAEESVAPSIATALGIGPGGDPAPAIASILADRRALLVLDTCEHVPSAVAHFCEVVLSRTTSVRILATSREVLRARSETVMWLKPLRFPLDHEARSLAETIDYPAVQLLVTRARHANGFAPTEADAAALRRLSARLDGSPLAIELFAPRLVTGSAITAAEDLDDRFLLLGQDRDRRPARQQSLLLTLRWSYALLSSTQARALRAISVFAGSFGASAAVQICAGVGLGAEEVGDALAELRAKSMLVVENGDQELRYRLLDSTRAFARDLLNRHEEWGAVSLVHARYVLGLLTRATSDQASLPQSRWRAAYAPLIDDLRAAIVWTLDRSADPTLGVALVAAALPLWLELSLGEEVRKNGLRALAEFDRLAMDNPPLKLRLVVGLASVVSYLAVDDAEASALFRTAVDLALQTGDPQSECRALGASATYELLRGRGRAAASPLAAMRQAARRAGLPAASWEEGQLRAQYEIRIGRFDAALARVHALHGQMRDEGERAVPRFQIHQRVNVLVQMAALNWLTGRPGAAIATAEAVAAEARTLDHGLTLIHCLSQGVVWTLVQCGAYDAVLPHIEILRDAIYRHGVAGWLPVAETYVWVAAAFRGDRPDPARLRSAFYGVRAGIPQIRHDARFTMIADAMLANGQFEDAAEVVDHVFATSPEPWGRSELLRIYCEAALARGRPKVDHVLAEALTLARNSGSPAWMLRCANVVAKRFAAAGDLQSARAALKPVLSLFGDSGVDRDRRQAQAIIANQM